MSDQMSNLRNLVNEAMSETKAFSRERILTAVLGGVSLGIGGAIIWRDRLYASRDFWFSMAVLGLLIIAGGFLAGKRSPPEDHAPAPPPVPHAPDTAPAPDVPKETAK